MAVDPFNSVGGYTVGIPPVPLIDRNGNLTVSKATIGNVTITGDQVVTGNIVANLFVGSFSGNISGNLVTPGSNNWVLYTYDNAAASSPNFTFDSSVNLLTVDGKVETTSMTIGVGVNELATTTTFSAATNSGATGQILHSVVANTVCSMDYTIIATDVTANTRQTSKLFASILGTDVGFYEYGTIDNPRGQGCADFSVAYDSGSGRVNLLVTPLSADSITYKILVTSYKE
jgi:hypothetical protein